MEMMEQLVEDLQTLLEQVEHGELLVVVMVMLLQVKWLLLVVVM
jgi:hypothetical protein